MDERQRKIVNWVRKIGIAEGISYLLLLGVAMPLKYFADWPIGVKVVGWAHGGLFVVLFMVTLWALLSKAVSFANACLVGVASLLPFGPFLMDRRLRADS